MNLRLVCLLFLVTGCQSSPQLMLTSGQQQELAGIATYVTQEAKAMQKDNMRVNRKTIDRLLAQQDTAVMSMLDDEQWQLYDTGYRDRLASKIYQTEIRSPSSQRWSGVTRDPVSMPIGNSGQQ